MRWNLSLLVVGIALAVMSVLSARASAQLYTREDLQQVRQSYAALLPIYIDFRSAFKRNDARSMERDYNQEQLDCRQVDAIDQRDTIDPSTNLFAASSELDNFCNDIETVWAAWEKKHHLPYDKRVIPAFLPDAFVGSDIGLKKMAKAMRDPSGQS